MNHSAIHWIYKLLFVLLVFSYGHGVALGVTPTEILGADAGPEVDRSESEINQRAAADVLVRSLKRMFDQKQLEAEQFYKRMQSLLSERS